MSTGRLGPYRLIHRLAAGGMAEIFLAVPEGASGSTDRVVIKRLFRELAQHDGVVQAFEREAQLMASIHHPGVPRILDAGRHGPDRFIAMEHVEGRELSVLLREAEGPCPWEAIVSLGHQLAVILGEVHACRDGRGRPLGLVHGDVNPSNVVVRPDGALALLDFGVAWVPEDADAGALPRGTLRYMAPEQITGGRLDGRADLHGWGAIVFEMTTGRPLRSGPDPQIMVAAVERDPPWPREVRSEVPPDLDGLIGACLARAPEERPDTADHVRATVERIARDHGWTLDVDAVAAWCRDPRKGAR